MSTLVAVAAAEIDMPLIGGAPRLGPPISAAFRVTPAYQAPAIAERTPVGTPLVVANPGNQP